MFTLIEDVKVLRPHYRLKETGPSGRPLVGPAIFGEGVDTTTLFTSATSNGVFFRGVVIDGSYYVTTATYKAKLYLVNSMKPAGLKCTVDGCIVVDQNLKPAMHIHKTLSEAFTEHNQLTDKRMFVKMPRIVDNCNRTKWLGLLSKPVWSKE